MGKRIVLIITGGIAAIKTLDLIRRLRRQEWRVRCVMTAAARRFVTSESIAALTGEAPRDRLFSDGTDDGFDHIRLSREADVLAVVPASADFLARMACGLAQDLAGAVVLARDKPLIAAPAMNRRMWEHPATRRNIATLRRDGVIFVEPEEGPLACGEVGAGRMADPDVIAQVIDTTLGEGGSIGDDNSRGRESASLAGSLAGRSALVTSGATIESIDPIRYIANRSSGRQGHAIARALSERGARTVLVTGPSTIEDPPGVETVRVEDARTMHRACMERLPCDIAVCAAAVADWRPERRRSTKIETAKDRPPPLRLTANPDILASIAGAGNRRPRLVIGFSAETSPSLERARRKMKRKGCDWMIHNDVSNGQGMGRPDNRVTILDGTDCEPWPRLDKSRVAQRLSERIADYFETNRPRV